ncbi:MAG: PE family protein [Mycobacterium sp.]|uniref:PE family protein n=1 Tax=Mycobacterium sp. TaxID=1785 RepID=UPI003F96BA16
MAAPEMMAAAATDVAAIGSTLNAAHMAAAAPTVAVIPATADEVSASIAHLFSGVAQDFHALVGQAATFGQQFAQHLNVGAGSYAATEAVSAASLGVPDVNSLVSTVNALPGQLLSMPLQLLNGLTSTFKTFTDVFNMFVNAFVLSAYVIYELLVFSYVTLAGLIGIELFLAKLLGVTIPIP